MGSPHFYVYWLLQLLFPGQQGSWDQGVEPPLRGPLLFQMPFCKAVLNVNMELYHRAQESRELNLGEFVLELFTYALAELERLSCLIHFSIASQSLKVHSVLTHRPAAPLQSLEDYFYGSRLQELHVHVGYCF